MPYSSKLENVIVEKRGNLAEGVEIQVSSLQNDTPERQHKKKYRLNSDEITAYNADNNYIKQIIERVFIDSQIELMDKYTKSTEQLPAIELNRIKPQKQSFKDEILNKRPDLREKFPPNISVGSVVQLEGTKAVRLHWGTDISSICKVEYRIDGEGGELTSDETGLGTEFTLNIDELEIGKTYIFKIVAKGKEGHIAKSNEYTVIIQ